MEVAVIGAGVAGLACAGALTAGGHRVQLVDKGRGPGGRTSTRRRGEERFDHGAAYFTARDPRFRQRVEELAAGGWVAPWEARFGVAQGDGAPEVERARGTRWVGAPRMSALTRGLAEELALRASFRVARLVGEAQAWTLRDEEGAALGPFARVVLSAPAPQTLALLDGRPPSEEVATAELAPCWALMITFAAPLALPFDALRLETGPISWLAREASKPGRAPGERWVVHACPEHSQQHLELAKEEMALRLTDALRARVGALPEVRSAVAHRWRYARVMTPVGVDALFDEASGIGACGDWCRGARVEEAYLSGLAMAARIAG